MSQHAVAHDGGSQIRRLRSRSVFLFLFLFVEEKHGKNVYRNKLRKVFLKEQAAHGRGAVASDFVNFKTFGF